VRELEQLLAKTKLKACTLIEMAEDDTLDVTQLEALEVDCVALAEDICVPIERFEQQARDIAEQIDLATSEARDG